MESYRIKRRCLLSTRPPRTVGKVPFHWPVSRARCVSVDYALSADNLNTRELSPTVCASRELNAGPFGEAKGSTYDNVAKDGQEWRRSRIVVVAWKAGLSKHEV